MIDNNFTNSVRRRGANYDGIYVKGNINGVKMLFTADTGATKTIIPKEYMTECLQ